MKPIGLYEEVIRYTDVLNLLRVLVQLSNLRAIFTNTLYSIAEYIEEKRGVVYLGE